MADRAPPIRFERGPCIGCGALTEELAETLCRPSTDETGERYCNGEFDDNGFSVLPTADSLHEMDAWIDKQTENSNG